ncbi:MAG: hypothetical protein D6704_11065 [Nitrospirae bacterium]|nr:MAG: hypothetical protein D6704_11065 [Nitrospirota bacterium]
MKCARCQGFMVQDQIFDPAGPILRIDIWRCVNCGATLYPESTESRKPQSDMTPEVHKPPQDAHSAKKGKAA